MKKSVMRKIRKALQCGFCGILAMAMVIEPMSIMAEEEEVASETRFEETDVDKAIDDVEDEEPIEQSIISIQCEDNDVSDENTVGLKESIDVDDEADVNGLASDYTADQAIAWVQSVVGQSLDWDGNGYQCAD